MWQRGERRAEIQAPAIADRFLQGKDSQGNGVVRYRGLELQPVSARDIYGLPARPDFEDAPSRVSDVIAADSANFQGRVVTEVDPGGGGPDTCWFQGSPYPKFEGLSGGSWDVGPGNIWGADVIGYGHLMVDYYRANNSAPCGTCLDQDMVINMPGFGWFRYNM